MEKVKLTWDEVRSLEDQLIENVQVKVLKAVSSIVESKATPIAFTQDSIYYDAGDSSYRAQWTLTEDKISIKDIEKIEISETDIHEQIDQTTEDLIDALEEDKDPSSVWGRFLDLCEEKFSAKKKIRVRKINESKKIIEEAKKPAVKKVSGLIKESIDKLNKVLVDFLGENEETEYVYDLKEDKVIQSKTPIKPIIRSLDESRTSAKKLNWADFIEDKHKFLDVNEEVFLLTRDEMIKGLTEAAKYSFDLEDEDIPSQIDFVIEQRKSHAETILNIFKPIVQVTEDAAIDDIIMQGDEVISNDKNEFLLSLSSLLSEIFATVIEQTESEDIESKAKNLKAQLDAELDSEEGVDKDVLAELAKAAVELAATLEGHEDTVSDSTDAEEKEKPAVDVIGQKTPSDYMAANEDDDEIEPMDADNPDLVDPEIGHDDEVEGEKWIEVRCQMCDSDFQVDMNKVKKAEDGESVSSDELLSEPEGEEPMEGCKASKMNEDEDAPEVMDEPEAPVEEPEEECGCSVLCPYCGADVTVGKDDNDEIIDNEFEDEVEEAGPAADQPAQELAGDVNYKVNEDDKKKKKKHNFKSRDDYEDFLTGDDPSGEESPNVKNEEKLDEQSPAADYEYIQKSTEASKLGAKDVGISDKFSKDPSTKKEDDTPKDDSSIQDKGATNNFKKDDNTSPKSEDEGDGEDINKKQGKGFKEGGDSKTKKDDELDSANTDDIVDDSQTHAGFKKDDNTAPKSDDTPADYETLTQVVKILSEKVYRTEEEERLLEEAIADLEKIK